MRRAAKIDDNQNEVVELFRKLGWSVQILSAVGCGCPDIAIGKHGINIFVEIKDGSKPPSKRKLTPDQVVWHLEWRGLVLIVETIDDVIKINEEYDGRRNK